MLGCRARSIQSLSISSLSIHSQLQTVPLLALSCTLSLSILCIHHLITCQFLLFSFPQVFCRPFQQSLWDGFGVWGGDHTQGREVCTSGCIAPWHLAPLPGGLYTPPPKQGASLHSRHGGLVPFWAQVFYSKRPHSLSPSGVLTLPTLWPTLVGNPNIDGKGKTLSKIACSVAWQEGRTIAELRGASITHSPPSKESCSPGAGASLWLWSPRQGWAGDSASFSGLCSRFLPLSSLFPQPAGRSHHCCSGRTQKGQGPALRLGLQLHMSIRAHIRDSGHA